MNQEANSKMTKENEGHIKDGNDTLSIVVFGVTMGVFLILYWALEDVFGEVSIVYTVIILILAGLTFNFLIRNVFKWSKKAKLILLIFSIVVIACISITVRILIFNIYWYKERACA